MTTPILNLKKGKEKPLLHHHPWLFSGAIEKTTGDPVSGNIVEIRSSSGEFLAWACYSSQSQIRARILSWEKNEIPDKNWIHKRMLSSIERRESLNIRHTSDALRLFHSESDGIPGLIVDRYGSIIVFQILTAGLENRKEEIAEILIEILHPETVIERSDTDVRTLEGLESIVRIVHGALPEPNVIIRENGLQFHVDLLGGHKTGWYLDQRENREILKRYAAKKNVLDCFSYTGGFAIHALAGGASHVTAVDSSSNSIALAKLNLELNQYPEESVTWIEGSVPTVLRKFRDEGRVFDLIILDPPKFAPTASFVEKATRAYKDINLLAMKLLSENGILFTFSCSGGVSIDLFQKILAGAAHDAKVQMQIIQGLAQASDHPVALHFPEGAYLKGFILRKIR